MATRITSGAGFGASSTSDAPYTATVPGSTGILAGDVIVIYAACNGTHSAGMTMHDDTNGINYIPQLETRQDSGTHYAQSFVYKTPIDIPDGSTFTYTPFTGSTGNAFCVDVWRGLDGSASVGAVGQSNTASTSQVAPALPVNAPAGHLVLTFDAASGGTLTAASPFATGATIVTTGQSVAIGYVSSASGSSAYGSTWTGTSSQTSGTQTMALEPVPPLADAYLVAEDSFASGSSSTVLHAGDGGGSGSNAAAGIFVIATTGSQTVVPTGVTDSKSNSYSLVGQVTINNECSYVFRALNTTALVISTDTVTVAWNSTSNIKHVRVIACDGIATSSAFDIEVSSGAFTGTSPSVTSGNLAQRSELAIAVVAMNNPGLSVTWPTGWNVKGSTLHSGTSIYSSVATKITSSMAPVTAAASLGANCTWTILLVTFKAIPPASPTITTTTLPDVVLGQTSTLPFSATDGTPSYSWSLSSGTLPPGMFINAGPMPAIGYVGANTGVDGIAGQDLSHFTDGYNTIGPASLIKTFYSNALPSTWVGSFEESITQTFPGVVPIICWNDTMSPTDLTNYCNTIPAGQVVGLCWRNEPENDPTLTAATFIAGWENQMTTVLAVGNPNILPITTTYLPPYINGGSALDGSWIPSPAYVGVYGADVYQHERGHGPGGWASEGLRNYQQVQNWMALVLPFNKPLAFPEYGVDNCLESTQPGKRAARIQLDIDYLNEAFLPGGGSSVSPYPLWGILYWWHNMSLTDCTKQHKFTDAASIASWQNLSVSSIGGGSSGGGLAGTPSTPGSYSFVIEVTDANGATDTQSLSINVTSSTPVMVTTTLPDGEVTLDYVNAADDSVVAVYAAGGLEPYVYTIDSGALPDGLAMDTDGNFSGSCTASGSFTFDVLVTDANSNTDTQSITITVVDLLTITSTSLDEAEQGSAYTESLTVSGGDGGVTYAVLDGSLPDGLAMDSTGAFTGTPTTVGTSGFEVQATDALGATASTALWITVAPPGGLIAIGNAGIIPRAGFPQVIIELGVITSSPVAPNGTFILSDPVNGLLDTGRLAAGDQWTDVTSVLHTASMTRPSTRVQGPITQFQGGTAQAVFDNCNGDLDWDNPNSPFTVGGATTLRPMIQLRARAFYNNIEYPVFFGFADAWSNTANFDAGFNEVSINASDGFKVLNGITLPTLTTAVGTGELSGTRIKRVLDAAGWYTDHRAISAGDSTLQATVLGDTALNLVQLVSDTEVGSTYMDGAGNFVFRARHDILENPRSAIPQAIFSDLAAGPGRANTNLLVSADTDFESGTGNWAAAVNCTFAQNFTHAHTGGASLALTSAASGTMSVKNNGISTSAITSGQPVEPGQLMTVSAWFLADATPRSVRCQVNWYDQFGVFVSTSTPVNVTDSTTAWTQHTHTWTVPAGVRYFLIIAGVVSTGGASEIHYVDDVSVILPELPYAEIDRAYDDTTLANVVMATNVNGLQQTAQDALSIQQSLFPRTYSRDDLILESDAIALDWATWVLKVSLGAEDRIEAITIDPFADPENLFPQILGRDIGDRITVYRRPYGTGATIIKDCFITGVSHALDVRANTWLTTWTLMEATKYDGFLILDDPNDGKLNDFELAF